MAAGWLCAFLLVQAFLDARTGYVSMPLLLAQAVMGVIAGGLKDVSGILIVWRFMPGIVLLCVSALSREGIGQGDAWLFVTLGVYLQAGEQMILFGAALFLAAVWILLFWRRDSVEKDRTLPFVPFVLAAYMGGCYYGWL